MKMFPQSFNTIEESVVIVDERFIEQKLCKTFLYCINRNNYVQINGKKILTATTILREKQNMHL